MVVYSVHSQQVYYHYKTYLCTKATLILVLTSLWTVMFPVIFMYRSHGFWLRTDAYREQPDVSFKYDYLLIVDTNKQGSLTMCTNLPHQMTTSNSFNVCPFIKAIEEDTNRDEYKDILRFTSQVIVPDDEEIHGITLLLFFDYKLSSYCRIQMESMALVQHVSPLPGSGLSVTADLDWRQQRPISSRRHHNLYNTSIIPLTAAFSLSSVLRQYALRNTTTRLSNVYAVWSTVPVKGEPFIVDVTIRYTEAIVTYNPSFWRILLHGWIQFFPILVVSILVFRSIKNFIFTNQLVTTYKQTPWMKF